MTPKLTEAQLTPTKRCCRRVYAGSFTGHMCELPYKVTRNGLDYCRIHDPEAVKDRRSKSNAKWQAESQARKADWDRDALARKALDYLELTQPDWESKCQ